MNTVLTIANPSALTAALMHVFGGPAATRADCETARRALESARYNLVTLRQSRRQSLPAAIASSQALAALWEQTQRANYPADRRAGLARIRRCRQALRDAEQAVQQFHKRESVMEGTQAIQLVLDHVEQARTTLPGFEIRTGELFPVGSPDNADPLLHEAAEALDTAQISLLALLERVA